jgi:hypothetical protein
MRSGEGPWQHGLEHGRGSGPVPNRSILYGDVAKNRRGGAPEGVRAARHAGTLRKGARLRRSANRRSASLTHVRDKGRYKALPRACFEGADESRLYQCCRRDALKSAGCLTCESVITIAGPQVVSLPGIAVQRTASLRSPMTRQSIRRCRKEQSYDWNLPHVLMDPRVKPGGEDHLW